MANTPTPDEVKNQAAALKEANEQLSRYKLLLNDASSGNVSVAAAVSEAKNLFTQSGIQLENLNNITSDTSRRLALIAGGAINAGKAFNYMSGVDVKNLNTWSSQLDAINDAIATAAGKGDSNQLINLAKAFKVSSNELSAATTKDATGKLSINTEMLSNSISKAAANMAQQADNALMLQEVYLSAAAATGNYEKVMTMANESLEGLNDTIDLQQALITGTARATQLTTDQVRQFYLALSVVPGALDATIAKTESSVTKMSMLQATMELAKGTGRDYADIIDDLNKAYENYGVTGEGALKFSAKISEVSNNLGMRLQDVRSGLNNVANSFRGVANVGESANRMIENAASLYNEYTAALQKTGLASTEASNIASNLIGKFKDLSLEQKAFLSSQTGGPGGLMGGFRIEKMLREGDVAGVQKLTTQMIERQFGKIVSLDEAAASQSAAAQRARQISLLRQGPLGSLAGSQEDAGRLLDALRLRKEGLEVNKLQNDYLQNQIDRGQRLRELTATPFSQARGEGQQFIESMQAPIRDMFQEAFAARQGFKLSEGAKEDQKVIATRTIEIRKSIDAAQKDAVDAVLNQVSRVPGTDTGKTSQDATKQMGVSISSFFKAGINTLANTMGSTFSRALLGTTDMVDVAAQTAQLATAVTNAISEKAATQSEEMAEQVTQATQAAAPAKKPAKPVGIRTEGESDVQRVDLKVTAICYHCKKELERESPHKAGTNAAKK